MRRDRDRLQQQALNTMRKIVTEEARDSLITRDGAVGMTPANVGNYSILRAVRAMAESVVRRQACQLGGLEGEVHRTLEARFGELRYATAFYVPLEVLHRDLTAGLNAGYLVGTTTGGSFVEALMNQSVAYRLGAQRWPGQRDTISMPVQTGKTTAEWLASEDTEGNASAPVLGAVVGKPKQVSALTKFSWQLLKQASPMAEALITTDLASTVALALDAGIINGSGSNGQPLGIINTPGVGSFAGTTLALDALTGAQLDVLSANAMLNPLTLGYATTPTVAKLLANRQRFNATDSPLWKGALHDGEIAGVRALSSLQLPSATMVYGDWSQVLVPEFGALAVEIDPYSNFKAGVFQARVLYSVDIMLRHVASFTVATSIS